MTMLITLSAGLTFPHYMSETLLFSKANIGTGSAFLGVFLSFGYVITTVSIACMQVSKYIDLVFIYFLLSSINILVFLE